MEFAYPEVEPAGLTGGTSVWGISLNTVSTGTGTMRTGKLLSLCE